MAFELSTVKAKVAYCVATTAGTRPTTGYVDLVGIKTAPDIDFSVETIDVSNLSDEYTRYIAARKDPGGEKVFSASNTPAFRTLWETFVSAAEAGYAAGKETYIAYIVDGDTEAFYWTGQPQALGHAGLEDNSEVTCSPKIVCNGIVGYAPAPTIGSGD